MWWFRFCFHQQKLNGRRFEFGFFGGWQGVRSFSSHQAQTEKVWTPADEVLSPLVEYSIFDTSDINIMKEFVILVIVTSTPCPPSMLTAVHLVSCCRLSADKKADLRFPRPFLATGSFARLIFRGLWRARIEWLELITIASPPGCVIHLAEQPAQQWTHRELSSWWSTSVNRSLLEWRDTQETPSMSGAEACNSVASLRAVLPRSDFSGSVHALSSKTQLAVRA